MYVKIVSDKMFQIKPNQTVLFLFPNLPKPSQPGSTCAVCSKFLEINEFCF